MIFCQSAESGIFLKIIWGVELDCANQKHSKTGFRRCSRKKNGLDQDPGNRGASKTKSAKP